MTDGNPNETILTAEVRLPVIRLKKLPTGEKVTLPRRQRVAELCDYLADHLYEHRALLSPEQFRSLLDDYARYRLMAQAGVEEYPLVIVEE